tara:strand:+ start:483 stop:827 length:345 start_codon:yes stop_codon:yes gene_type:complete
MNRPSPRAQGLLFETELHTFHLVRKDRKGKRFEFRTYQIGGEAGMARVKSADVDYTTSGFDGELEALEAFRLHLVKAGIVTKVSKFPPRFFPGRGQRVCRFNPHTDMFYAVKVK